VLTVVPMSNSAIRSLIVRSRPNNALARSLTTLPERSRTLCTTPASNPGGGLSPGVLHAPMSPLAAPMEELLPDAWQVLHQAAALVEAD
jgi:hypothetical protein